MIIEDRVIFISIIKTAGTTIRNIWSENHLVYGKHTSIYNLWSASAEKKNKLPEINDRKKLLDKKIIDNKGRVDPDRIDLKNYYIFTVVRNPYDRLVSLYYYLKEDNKKYKMMNYLLFIDNINTFSEFVHYLKNNWDELKYNIGKPMIKYIIDKNNKIVVNKIVKFEDLQKDMNDVFEKTGLTYIDFNKTHLYKSKIRKHWREYYNKELLDIVNKLYHEDFKIFNYKTINII